MDKFLKENIRVPLLAATFVENMRVCIKKLNRLRVEGRQLEIQTASAALDLHEWLVALSFITRKISAVYLGETDLDFEIEDIGFSYKKAGGSYEK